LKSKKEENEWLYVEKPIKRECKKFNIIPRSIEGKTKIDGGVPDLLLIGAITVFVECKFGNNTLQTNQKIILGELERGYVAIRKNKNSDIYIINYKSKKQYSLVEFLNIVGERDEINTHHK